VPGKKNNWHIHCDIQRSVIIYNLDSMSIMFVINVLIFCILCL